MMAGKVVSLGFEIISKLDSYFLMTVMRILFSIHGDIMNLPWPVDKRVKCLHVYHKKANLISVLGAVNKLRNVDGVGGWSAKALLLQSLIWYVINKMTAETLL